MKVGDSKGNLIDNPEALPPAHPHLVEHLRERFAIYLPSDPNFSAEASHAFVHTRQGEQNVIEYIESLINKSGLSTTSNFNPQKDQAYEPGSPQDQGPDPRSSRTRGRSRGIAPGFPD